MRCPSCGADLGSGVRFCSACGHSMDAPATASPPAASSAPASSPSGQGAGQQGYDDPYIGQVLNNRFTIESKLGEGGFGAVYRGVQKGTGRKVAIKLLHPEMTQDDNLVARFRREGLLMCNLNDAHTVTTYDFDQTPDGTLFIAMEMLEGKSLHDLFHAEAPLDWARMLRIIVQMCSSLAEAHAQGIVHRDLKPENIHLEHRAAEPEFVKILDFGIAKVMQGEGGQRTPQLTATGQTLGTLEYMSPEQLMGKELDGRSDIYTVGVLAYEMITGRLPFPDAKGPAALITAQLRQVPPRPSQVIPEGKVPPAVDAIVLRMLEKDKAKRFATVDELRVACTEALGAGTWAGSAVTPAQGAPVQAAPVGAPASTPGVPAGMPGAPAGTPMQPGAPVPNAAMQAALPQSRPVQNVPRQPPSGMGMPGPGGSQMGMPVQAPPASMMGAPTVVTSRVREDRTWLWIVLALIALGSIVGAAVALG